MNPPDPARAPVDLDTDSPAVTVHLFAAAAEALGRETMTVPAVRVREVMTILGAGAPEETLRILGRCSVLVNSVACRDLDHALSAGDRVDVLPPFAGG